MSPDRIRLIYVRNTDRRKFDSKSDGVLSPKYGDLLKQELNIVISIFMLVIMVRKWTYSRVNCLTENEARHPSLSGTVKLFVRTVQALSVDTLVTLNIAS